MFMQIAKLVPKSVRRRILRPLSRVFTSKILTTGLVVLISSGIAVWTSEQAPQNIKDFFELVLDFRAILTLLFDSAESIAITSAGLVFLLEFNDRRKRRRYEAWGVINSAQGQSGNGGRTHALAELNREGVDLEAVTVPNADLSGVNLCFGKLLRADFENTQLDKADFEGANLQEANLSRASLWRADLRNARLVEANLHHASLDEADLSNAFMAMAKLQGAELVGATLQNANLRKADLLGASLWNANLEMANLEEASLQLASLRNANFRGANFRGANLERANLEGAECWTDEQLEQAYICKTILPEGSLLNPNRDCAKT